MITTNIANGIANIEIDGILKIPYEIPKNLFLTLSEMMENVSLEMIFQ